MKIKDILQKDNINEKKLALAQVLNLSIPEIVLKKEQDLTQKEEKQYLKLEKKIKKGLPIQYILNKAYFYNNEFYINKNVLIPRPETEYLVEKTNKLINNQFTNQSINILDIGTGSGVIAITLKMLNKNANITATDISKKALKVAQKNSEKYETEITLKQTNLYKGLKEQYDVIISNPPYIEKKDKNIEEKVKKHEPHQALFAKDNGLYFYKEIIKNIKSIAKENHIIAFEIGDKQGKEITKLLQEQFPNDKIIIEKDYNNYERYIYSISKKA